MGWYAEHIFSRIMDWVMSGQQFEKERHRLLAQARGTVLEIGIGMGLNLPHYPPCLSCLHAIDPVVMLPRRIARRIAAVPFPVHIHRRGAESLPFEDASFDCAVSTWALCSIADPVAALKELRRVLKPDGVFLFLDHGRSQDERIAAWQDRLNSLQRIVACGCNLNRKIDEIIRRSGLTIVQLDRFTLPRFPRLTAEMYRGVALPLSP